MQFSTSESVCGQCNTMIGQILIKLDTNTDTATDTESILSLSHKTSRNILGWAKQ